MPFIAKADFPQSVHDDILNALTKGDDSKITRNCESTIDEMKAYLNGRYDVDAIFDATGNDRNRFLLRIALSITLYFIYKIHNPRKLPEEIQTDYEKAMSDLEKIRDGELNPVGLPAPPTDQPEANSGNNDPVQWGSDDALENSY